jgi:hypothetical protein
LKCNYRHLFPKLPDRTRLFRLFNTHRHWTESFMAQPSLICSSICTCVLITYLE